MITRFDTRGLSAARIIASFGLIGLFFLIAMTMADVFMRALFNSPIDGVADLSRLVVPIVTASFFPICIAERHNISIEFLGKWLGPAVDRWLVAVATLVTTLVFIIISWQLTKYTLDLYAVQETTWILGWPVAPWWTVATVFMILCVPAQAIVTAVCWHSAITSTQNTDSCDTGASDREIG